MAYYISTITLPNNNQYEIKDASAWNQIYSLWDTISVGNLELVVLSGTQNLPTANADTMGKIYLKPDNTHDPSANDIYDEYITIDLKSGSPRYKWEKIGNTDVNLSNYSLKTHKHTVDSHIYTPAGTISTPTFSGNSLTSSGTFKPSGTIAINASTSRTSQVSTTTSGTATYTPTGTVSQPTFTGNSGTVTVSGSIGSLSGTANTDSSGSHFHTLGGTTKYLHSVKVPKTFGTTSVLTNVSTSKLATTSIKGIKGTDTINSSYTLNKSSYGSASGWSSGTASSWSFTVGSGTETLIISGGNGTTPSLTINNVSVGTSLTAGGSKTFAIAADSSTIVATGSLDINGDGSAVAVGNGSNASVYSSIISTSDSFTADTTSISGTAFVSALDATTGTDGAHIHSGTFTINAGSIESTGTFTPSGTVSTPTFTGTGVRQTVTINQIPTQFGFTGNEVSIYVSGTPSGTVSTPTFSGTQTTLPHIVSVATND